MKKRIYLTGFMTSGKSTIGPILANVLGWGFFDLDSVIEKKEGKSVVKIFEDEGEEYFRKVESELLIDISLSENVIVSLGGGTIASAKNLEVMKNNGTIVYLKVSPEMLYKRLKYKTDRPLFRDIVLSDNTEEDFISRIKKFLGEREIFYNQADLIIDTDTNRVGLTVDLLVNKLKKST